MDTKGHSNLLAVIQECQFETMAPLDPTTLRFVPEVRSMCGSDRCHSFGKNWKCPPAAPGQREVEKIWKSCDSGVLVQTVGPLEDEFDYDSMEKARELHETRLRNLAHGLRPWQGSFQILGAGPCKVCPVCTYPHQECRHPDLAAFSMEAMGLVVSDVCTANGVPYYHGNRTIAFVSAILLSDSLGGDPGA